jgi:hypothetical protein
MDKLAAVAPSVCRAAQVLSEESGYRVRLQVERTDTAELSPA